MTNQEFIYELIKIIRKYEQGSPESYFFRYDTIYFKDKGSTDDDLIRATVDCSDTFAYACADGEDVTPDDLPALRQAYEDVGDEHWLGTVLYVARKRNMRPVPELLKNHADLFVDLGSSPYEKATG